MSSILIFLDRFGGAVDQNKALTSAYTASGQLTKAVVMMYMFRA